MRLIILFSLLFALLVVSAAHADSITADGRQAAQVYLPTQYSPAKTWPVVLLLHGYMSNDSMIESYFRLGDQVSHRGFILVVPNGKVDSRGFQFWNATEGCCDFDHSKSDDVGYLKHLLKQVAARYHVDPTRISAAGHSNGAFLAHRLACEANSPVTAIASFAGEVPLHAADCRPSHAVSVLQIHAIDDDTIRYAGDPKGYPNLAPYPGTAETVKRWLERDHCTRSPMREPVKHVTDGNDTDAERWNKCASGTWVELWKIRAYTWPPHAPHMPPITDEFTQSVLDFLLRTPN